MDDPLFALAALFPPLMVVAGLAFVAYSVRERTPGDMEADVLAALSAHEALPVARICARPPLRGQRINAQVVHFTLEHLRRTGQAVRWYSPDDEVVYRRVA